MAQARLATQIAYIPLLSSYIGENVLQSTPMDKQFSVRAKFVGDTQQDKDIGIPMPIYAENVLPTSQGWESVHYSSRAKSLAGAKFDQLLVLKSGTETDIMYSPSHGKNYVYYSQLGWVASPEAVNYSGMVTSAYTKLKAFVFYQRQQLLSYDYAQKLFKPELLNGLNIKNIDGILAANNYLIAWNDTTVYWSSTLDPLDFIPSLSSGAGSMNPTQVRGRIVACLPVADGFIIYTTANAIAALWSGNIRYPWSFREIPGSSGIRKIEHVTYESNYDGHFVWSVDGLQSVTKTGAKLIFSEVTDFLSGKLVEEYIGPNHYQSHVNNAKNGFNSATQDFMARELGPNLLQEFLLEEEPWVKLSFIGSRYLIISYGYRVRGEYDWALVYDSILERWGKLKINHVDCFNYVNETSLSSPTKHSIGFLFPNGEIQIVDPALYNQSKGILLYGRLKDRQGQWLDLEGVKCQTLTPLTPALYIIPSYTGADLLPAIVPYLATDTTKVKEWYCRAGGESMNLLFSGSFSLSSIVIDFSLGGVA